MYEDYVWVKCPTGHGKPGFQHFDYCGLCHVCGAVMMEIGLGLDAIGSLPEVNLPRASMEPDHDYRERLIARLRGEEAPRDTSVRDAIHANP